jgi:hypothetical protein
MGWVACEVAHDFDVPDHNTRGYKFKLCPYSTEYKELYRFDGRIYTGYDGSGQLQYQDGIWVIGNSVNPAFRNADYITYTSSSHTTTNGRMEYAGNPPGWICRDPNCYFRTTVVSGSCYREA